MSILALLAAATLSQAAETSDMTPLNFLAGHWRTEMRVMRNGPYYSEEIWTSLAGHVMVGLGRSLYGVDSASFEYMRIARGANGGIAFYGQPNGAPAVAFRLVHATADEAVFENREHDFPQRIAYRREGDMLTATVCGSMAAARRAGVSGDCAARIRLRRSPQGRSGPCH